MEGVETVEVRVRLSIARIMEIDIVGQTFTVEFQLEASWLDDSLAGKAADSESSEYDEYIIDVCATKWSQPDGVRILGSDKHFFSPMIRFRNSIELTEMEEWGQVFPKEKTGIVCYRMKTRGKFQQNMDLHSFPVDTQDLIIILSSGHEANTMNPSINEPTDRRYAFKRVELRQNLSGKYRSFANVRSFTFGNEYDLQEGIKFTQGVTAKDESASLRQYPTLSMAVVVTRKVGYWAFNVVLPLYLITSVSCASFAVPPEEVADRCSITMTMMLTTVAYKYLISDRLPTISYLTLIDQYVLVNMLLQVAFIIIIVVQGGIANTGNYAANSQPYQIRFVVFLTVIWTIFHVALVMGIWLWKLRRATVSSTVSNKLWVRALRPEANMHTLLLDLKTAQNFLFQRQSNHNPTLSKSLQKINSLLRNGASYGIGSTTIEDKCDEKLAVTIKRWVWREAETHWVSNGKDPQALKSMLREDFSVVTFQDEVSADEFIRVMTYFVLDTSSNKPLLQSFEMATDVDQLQPKSENDSAAIAVDTTSGVPRKDSQGPRHLQRHGDAMSKVKFFPQLVHQHRDRTQEQIIKIEKLNPDWDVFTLGFTVDRNRKILNRGNVSVIRPTE